MKPDNNQENFDKCVCINCTLFTDCNRDKMERLFCARQRSKCSMDSSKLCICGSCPVFKENKLIGGYFCLIEIK
jgi:hypothetical protein